MIRLKEKELVWIGRSLKDLREFPEEVMDEVGYALYQVQEGIKPRQAKSLHGFSHGVMEIVSDYDANTYRAVYTTKIGEIVYVLHCFQKKSTHGISTPKRELDLIQQRLQEAMRLNKMRGD